MEIYINQIQNKTFLEHYELQDALISENALVATAALKILLTFTVLRKNFVLKNFQEISKLELNKTDGDCSEGVD